MHPMDHGCVVLRLQMMTEKQHHLHFRPTQKTTTTTQKTNSDRRQFRPTQNTNSERKQFRP